MANLYLVRHGESQANSAGLISCNLQGLGLTKLGKEQIAKIAATKLTSLEFDCIYTSPLLRTIESAIIINDLYKGKKEIIIDDRIKEIDYGYYNNKNKKEVDRKIGETLSRIMAGDNSIRFGENGENESEIMERIYDFLIDLAKKNQNCVVITHQGVIDKILQTASEFKRCVKKHEIKNACFINLNTNIYKITKLRSLQKTYKPDHFSPYTLINGSTISRAVFFPSIELANNTPVSTPFTFPFKEKNVVLALDKMNWWNPVGGHIERDETWKDTLVREAKEEAGIDIVDISVVGYIKIERLRGDNQKYPPISIIPITTSRVIKYQDKWTPMETKKRGLFKINHAKKMLRLRSDNGQMAEIFDYITNYCLNYG